MSLIQYVVSKLLRPEHVDVTEVPVTYSSPKDFKFPSKRQLLMSDANRRYRQALRDGKVIDTLDITNPVHSIDNREVLTGHESLGTMIQEDANRFVRVAKEVVASL